MSATHIRNITSNDNWCFMKREDDGEIYAIGVLNIRATLVTRVLQCQNMHLPRDQEEGRAVAYLHLFAGLPLPNGLYQFLNGNLPLPYRRVYSCQPIHERRDPVLNYAEGRDEHYNMRNCAGSMRHHVDRAQDRCLCLRYNIPLSGVIPPVPDPAFLQAQIDQLRQALAAAQQQQPGDLRTRITQLETDLAAKQARSQQLQQDLATETMRVRRLERKRNDERQLRQVAETKAATYNDLNISYRAQIAAML